MAMLDDLMDRHWTQVSESEVERTLHYMFTETMTGYNIVLSAFKAGIKSYEDLVEAWHRCEAKDKPPMPMAVQLESGEHMLFSLEEGRPYGD